MYQVPKIKMSSQIRGHWKNHTTKTLHVLSERYRNYGELNRCKQRFRKLELPSAEDSIREAEELRQDERLLPIVRGFKSLLSAELQCHEKCQKDYVRCVPAKKILY